VTEVIHDFVFTPPQAQIGLQRSDFPSTEAHLCTASFVFHLGNIAYVIYSYFVVCRLIKWVPTTVLQGSLAG
jgi:hypothetical protein